jgi:hypothetical protein
MPRTKKTEPWADFCERIEALEMGINTHLLYKELQKSPRASLMQYIIYLRSELVVHRKVMDNLEYSLAVREAAEAAKAANGQN